MINLDELAEDMAFKMDEHQKSVTMCLGQAFDACNEIVRLAKNTARLGRFKVLIYPVCFRIKVYLKNKLTGIKKIHIFLPILLSRTIGFLISRHPLAQPDGVVELMSILQGLSYVNRQAEELVQELNGVVGQ